MYHLFIKRGFDILFSAVALIIFSPLLLIVSILLILDDKGSPFFLQLRPGKNQKLFRIIKFRTMNDTCDIHGNLLDGNKRITKIGKWLRKTSIDELPQLMNVFNGDMSLVGPRPLLTEYLPIYNKNQARRHEVKPGVTGWAQVNGRNAISWEEKFKLDIWYIDHISFFLDLKIAFLTVIKVIGFRNVNLSEDLTMEKFTGNN